MLRRIQVRPGVPLVVDLDPIARMAKWPETLRIKGMFFTHLVEILGSDATPLLAKLDDPPRNGRYLPFVDYPQLDHAKLFVAAARKKWPHATLHEAMRQLGRANYDAFLTSTVGQVMASTTKDASQALDRLPDALKLVRRRLPREVVISRRPSAAGRMRARGRRCRGCRRRYRSRFPYR